LRGRWIAMPHRIRAADHCIDPRAQGRKQFLPQRVETCQRFVAISANKFVADHKVVSPTSRPGIGHETKNPSRSSRKKYFRTPYGRNRCG
jgi:hypothetical protein